MSDYLDLKTVNRVLKVLDTAMEEQSWSTDTLRVEKAYARVRAVLTAPPVPPLPTEPYTVIRGWWSTELSTDLWLTRFSYWVSQNGTKYDGEDLTQLVRFEVLAVPEITALKNRDALVRRETAAAVIDRMRSLAEKDWPGWLDSKYLTNLATEFGVTR